MCYGRQNPVSPDDDDDPILPPRGRSRDDDAVSPVEMLRGRLAETEARLERARAREAELTRRLEAMRRFVSVMEILESYLKRRFREQQESVARLFSSISAK